MGKLVEDNRLLLTQGLEVMEVAIKWHTVGVVAVVQLPEDVNVLVNLLELRLQNRLVSLQRADHLAGIL